MYKTKNEKIVAIIEARMSSSRLPGKVLLPIGTKPSLALLIERLRRSRYLDGICIATTTNKQDDLIIELAEKMEVAFFRGSESDVLGRVLGAAQNIRADIIVEITGDCPFVDPTLVDRGIDEFFTHDVDYASNTIIATYANGFDVQVFPTKILAEVDKKTQDPVDRTHVSYYIYQHPETYRLYNWQADSESYGPELRMTLDEKSDYEALCKVADALSVDYPQFDFGAKEITQYLLNNPDVIALNANVRQKEAYEL